MHSHEPAWLNWLAELLLEQVDILHWESRTKGHIYLFIYLFIYLLLAGALCSLACIGFGII
jgi:hypothetical protein